MFACWSCGGVIMRIGVLVVDSEKMTRVGIALLIGRMNGLDVVGMAANGRTALNLIRDRKPKVVVSSLIMPAMNGIDLVTRAREDFPAVRTIILSGATDDDCALRALRSGAYSYLSREMGEADLENAIRAAAKGEVYIPIGISKRIVEALRRPRTSETDVLTSRQRAVLQAWVEGGTSVTIAATLNMSCKTVESYKSQIRDRLGIRDLGALVKYAVRNGITPL